MNLFRKKLPEAEDAPRLRRCLTAWDLTFMGIGQMIGTGIFVLTGVAAATQAGPAIILSFVVAGIACAFVAFAYAELASSVGGCGGAYAYSYAAFGELAAWTIGWNLVFGLGTALAAVANGWSGYFNNALATMGLGLPELLIKGPFAGGLINLPAMAVILTLMLALFAGVKQSARLNKMIVFVKLLALAIFIGVAAFHVNPALWHPFMPYGWFSHRADGGTVGILAGASLVFFAYRGFQNVSIAVEEAQNPQRDVPIGVIASLATCTLIYLVVAGLLTAIAPYDVLNVSSPVAFALLRLGLFLGRGPGGGRRDHRPHLDHADDLLRPDANGVRDGARRIAAAVLQRVTMRRTRTPVNAIVLGRRYHGSGRGTAPLGALAELVNAGTLGGIHPGVRRRDRAACDQAARDETAFQGTGRHDHPRARRPLLWGAAYLSAAGDAAAFCTLSRGRRRGLFRLYAARRTGALTAN